MCKFEGIVLAHQMYHYIKLSRYQEVVRCRTNSDIDRLREAAFRFGIASSPRAICVVKTGVGGCRVLNNSAPSLVGSAQSR